MNTDYVKTHWRTIVWSGNFKAQPKESLMVVKKATLASWKQIYFEQTPRPKLWRLQDLPAALQEGRLL